MLIRISFLEIVISVNAIIAMAPTAISQSITDGQLFHSVAFTETNGFTGGVEGPSVDKNGNLYAVNFTEQGTIGKVTPTGKSSVFIRLPQGSIANGSRFTKKGNMIIADYTGHNIYELNIKSRNLRLVVHAPQMTQPNDVAVDSKGHIYASDPDFKANTGRIWLIETGGSVVLLDSLGPANGIEVSTDERTLYVGAGRSIWSYDLSKEGKVSNKRLLMEFPDFGTDGMRCDIRGNLYIARIGKGVIVKISPQGKILQEIQLIGKKPTNVAFGGKDGCTVYVTMMDKGNIESFRTDIPGREWYLQKR